MTMKHKIFIADRGNVQFWYPEDWKVTPQKNGSVKFEDPAEDCVIVSGPHHVCLLAGAHLALPAGFGYGARKLYARRRLSIRLAATSAANFDDKKLNVGLFVA